MMNMGIQRTTKRNLLDDEDEGKVHQKTSDPGHQSMTECVV